MLQQELSAQENQKLSVLGAQRDQLSEAIASLAIVATESQQAASGDVMSLLAARSSLKERARLALAAVEPALLENKVIVAGDILLQGQQQLVDAVALLAWATEPSAPPAISASAILLSQALPNPTKNSQIMLEQPGLLEETSGEMLAPVAVAVELPGAIRYPSLLPSLTPAELKSSYLSSGPTVPSFAWEKSSPSEFSSSFSHSADLHDSSRECKFTAPFDTNGALYVIATASKTCPYVNPVTSDLLAVRWSSVGSGKPDDFVSHGTPRTMAATANQPNSWMEVRVLVCGTFLMYICIILLFLRLG